MNPFSLSVSVKLLFALDSGTRRSLLHRLSNGRAAKAKEEGGDFVLFRETGCVEVKKVSHRLSNFQLRLMFLLSLFLLLANLIFRTHEKGDDDMRTRIGELVFVT